MSMMYKQYGYITWQHGIKQLPTTFKLYAYKHQIHGIDDRANKLTFLDILHRTRYTLTGDI